MEDGFFGGRSRAAARERAEGDEGTRTTFVTERGARTTVPWAHVGGGGGSRGRRRGGGVGREGVGHGGGDVDGIDGDLGEGCAVTVKGRYDSGR